MMRATITVSFAVVGLALSVVLNHFFGRFSAVIQRPWYESLWLPLWVACLTFGVASPWARERMPIGAIQGLFVTAPPYGWLLMNVYFRRGSEGVDGFAFLLIGLAVSGAVLNPLIAGIVAVIGRRVHPPVS